MAMTISGLSEAQLDDQLIPAIQANVPLLDAFSVRLEGEGGEGLVVGNSYIVPVVGALTVSDKTAGTTATANASLTGKSVAASAFKGVSWELKEGQVAAKLAGAYMAEQAVEGVSKIAQVVVDAALGNLTAANYGNSSGTDKIVEALADFDLDTIAAFRAAAKTKLKGAPGCVILNSYYASKALTLSPVVMAQAVTQGKDVFAAGAALQTSLFGYRAFEYCDLPGNSENLGGAIIGKGAIAIVAGAPDQLITSGQGDVAYRRIVTDSDSGLGVQYTESVIAGGKITGEVAIIYGTAKAIDAAVRLVSE